MKSTLTPRRWSEFPNTPRRAWPLAVSAFLALGGPARAQDQDGPGSAGTESSAETAEKSPAESPEEPPGESPAAEPDSAIGYYPPPVAGPALRLPESLTHLYVDGAYADSKDLSALPYIAGRGRNYRVAVGGAWRWRRFTFEGELPFLNVTTLDVTEVPGGMPMPQDMHQTTVSLGDAIVGAIWTTPLVGRDALLVGLGLRGRLATHTTRFTFHLTNGDLALYSFPYYFHVEPTAILGGALGRFTFVTNQGANVFIGPDGNVNDQHITVPTIYFWEAHYAVGYAPVSFLGASVEFATDFQLNSIGGLDFAKFNGVRAAWIAPALQLHFGDVRVDLIARLGLTRGQELFGVLEYVGTSSYTVRINYLFN